MLNSDLHSLVKRANVASKPLSSSLNLVQVMLDQSEVVPIYQKSCTPSGGISYMKTT